MPSTRFRQHGFSGRLVSVSLVALLAFAMLVIVPGTVGSANAGDDVVPPCPFDRAEDRILVGGGFLLGASPVVPNAFTVDTAVPQGVYRVSWASYDAHNAHPGQWRQTEEIWYLDAGGDTSDKTQDIPDEPIETIQGVLPSYFVVGTDQPNLTIRHGGPAGKINSVYPVCAALDPVPAPTLTIVKNTLDGDGTFNFLSEELGQFQIMSASGSGTLEFAPLDPGTYNIAEDLQALGNEWTFTSLICDGATESVTTGASASVTLGAGDAATCTFTNTYTPRPMPGIDIEKSTNGEDADTPTGPFLSVDATVNWAYTVTNTGDVPLADILVTDDKGVAVNCPEDALAPGASMTCTAIGTAQPGQYVNVGTVTGTDTVGVTVTDSDTSHYFGSVPAIDIIKDVDPAIIPGGETTDVMWTITVTNAGNVPLTDVKVTDELTPACDLPIGDLAIGETTTYTCISTLTPDVPTWMFTNVAISTGSGPAGTQVTARDDAVVAPDFVAASATIGDTVWADDNANGVQDSGEKGIANARVRLTFPDGTVQETTTNSNGLYLFSALEAGTYKAELIISSIPKPAEGDLMVTTNSSFTVQLADGQSYLDADFGVVATLPKTGLDTGAILGIALALLLGGAATVLVTRRKEDAGDALA